MPPAKVKLAFISRTIVNAFPFRRRQRQARALAAGLSATGWARIARPKRW